MINLTIFLTFFLLGIQNVASGCYFLESLQGQYVMQTKVNGSQVEYSTVNITQDSIPIWGQCYQKNGNNYILRVPAGSTSCFRCFHLKLRSRNILQVHTVSPDYLSTCVGEMEAACPSEEAIQKVNATTEIMLYRKYYGNQAIFKPEYCPIHGSFTFTYDSNNGINQSVCLGRYSKTDLCPSGSAINLHFKNCSFENTDITFKCLGHWEGRNNQKFLALMDTRKGIYTKYRCAIYREEANGSVSMALSSDSTCVNNLYHASHGYEAYHFYPIPQNDWPFSVERSVCSFPKWLLGKWQDITVNDNTLLFKDHTSFKTYTNKCLRSAPGNDNENDTKYFIFSKTQCGDESYNCIWIKKRSTNVLEFQIGSRSSPKENPNLCDSSNFNVNTWITQARLRKEPGECPVAGEYTGILPDGPQYCAKLWSDCQAPDTMYYEISDCQDREIFEQRQYKCLGQWEEKGLLYTYTQRVDLAPSFYECFVGSIVSEKQFDIMEAGQNCQRMRNIVTDGMQLTKKGACYGPQPGVIVTSIPESVTQTTLHTEHWTPSSAPPFTEFDNGITGSGAQNQMYFFPIYLGGLFIYRLII